MKPQHPNRRIDHQELTFKEYITKRLRDDLETGPGECGIPKRSFHSDTDVNGFDFREDAMVAYKA